MTKSREQRVGIPHEVIARQEEIGVAEQFISRALSLLSAAHLTPDYGYGIADGAVKLASKSLGTICCDESRFARVMVL